MTEKNSDLNKEIDSSNIFDEFAQEPTLVNEVNRLKNENSKDKFYYLSKSAQVLQTFFWILFFLLILLVSYIYIQNKEDFKNSNLLDPICFVFLWDIKNEDSFCSSISSLNKTYKDKFEEVKATQVKETLSILEAVYQVENFTKTKEILFLSDKSENKLKVLKILEEFDNIKNWFDKIDKQKIQCFWLSIDWTKKTLSMNCSAYSSWYERWFKWFNAEVDNSIKWTSISIANSFLNYISKTSNIFSIEDRQKIFKSESILWEKTDFTNKTNFSLKLKYNIQ